MRPENFFFLKIFLMWYLLRLIERWYCAAIIVILCLLESFLEIPPPLQKTSGPATHEKPDRLKKAIHW